jgi:hypothetical protein
MVWAVVLSVLLLVTLAVLLVLVGWVGRWRDRVHVPKAVFFALFNLPNPAYQHDGLARQWSADIAEQEAVRIFKRRRTMADSTDRGEELAA